ncbi:Rad9-domain-containing protein, partial [Mrakia frigida]|uniref:Rad9-domain-containing protein n=1 Tax=Mrakia frigida TaxID=29902 RepID=UPI003FCC1C6C
MSLEASLTPYSLKKLTSALACLSRFGEDVHIQAVKTELVLSTLNSSKTSYAQFTFSENFFESYEVEMATKKGVTCHLNAKALLGVFRSRGSLEKTAERCDISLYDSERKKPSRNKKDKERKRRKVTDSDEDENDNQDGSSNEDASRSPSPSPAAKPPPSRLNIKFLCNNGFIKTHSLFISTSHSTRRPTNNTEGEDTSAFKVSPKHVSEWMEPFPGWISQGAKSAGGQRKEGYLAWTFGDHGVKIGTWEGEFFELKRGKKKKKKKRKTRRVL